MPTERTITLYTYDELSPKAKEKARDWWLSCRDETDYESVIEDFREVATRLGVTFKMHEVRLMSGKTRQDPNIWWRLSYSQSDYASFDGLYTYHKGATAAVKDYAPQDYRLNSIAESLLAVQKRYRYRLTAVVTHHHYFGQQVECFLRDSFNEVADEDLGIVQAAFRELSNWLYCQLEQEDQALSEEEAIAEAMDANGYTFREDGTRED